MKIIQNLKLSDESGYSMPFVLSIIILFAILSTVVLGVIQNNLFQANNNERRQKAFNIAEAGINYYLWHLSHSASDFKDGQTTPVTPDPQLGYGPYEHKYIDDNGLEQGTYTLWIKPQSVGSTIAVVRSIGKVKNTGVIRTVEAQIGAPSFASYVLATDSAVWFGNTEAADGPVHSNVGIRMDGDSNTDVTSANSTYVPPSNLGGNGSTSRPGVWCSTSITSPINCNTRDKSDWRFPVPAVDFNLITSSLCTIKKTAFSNDAATSAIALQANACTQTPTTRTAAYLPQRATNGSYNLARGYLIQLNNNGTYDLYYVNGETDTNATYSTALTTQSVASGIAIPSSGVIFTEDNVWVRTNPTLAGRVTIAAGRLATSSNANIVAADDIVYSTKSGSDALGLIAEGSFMIAPYAPPASGGFNFEIDAAIIAQSGNAVYGENINNGRSTYRSNSTRCTRGWVSANQTFTFYGSVATRQLWTWTWLLGSSCGDAVYSSGAGAYVSGILNNSTQYDYNLLYAPPPSYPTTSSFSILSWREVLTQP